MPKKANPNRERAFEIYNEHPGNFGLVEIAKQLNRLPGTVKIFK